MSERDEPRRPPIVCESRSEVVDMAADKGFDAIEFGGVSREDVVSAFREAADEIESHEEYPL